MMKDTFGISYKTAKRPVCGVLRSTIAAKRRHDIAWGVNPRFGMYNGLRPEGALWRCRKIIRGNWHTAPLQGATEFEWLPGVHTPGCIMLPLRGFGL